MATQVIDFSTFSTVTFDGTTCDNVIFDGTTIYTSALASYAYTNARDYLYAGNTYSDTKTFPTSVASGSTNINVSGTMYWHYTDESSYWDPAYTSDLNTQVQFKVALYNGSTLLHTTAYSSWFTVDYTLSPDSITYDIDFTAATVSSNITKAVLYRNIKNVGNSTATLCHGVCPSDTVTIG